MTHLDHFLTVLCGIHGRLCQQDLCVRWIDVHLFGPERVVPHVAHVVPVAHHAVLHGIGDL